MRKVKNESSGVCDSVRALGAKKRDRINSIKDKNVEANRWRKERDRINSKIKGLKKEREKENNAAKELIAEFRGQKGGAPGVDFRQMQKELNMLEWRIQTSVMDARKEDEMVKRIEVIKKELEGHKELIELSTEIDKHRTRSQKFHTRILALSEESQGYHEKFLPVVEDIKKVEAKIEELNKEKAEITPELDGYKENIDGLSQKIKEIEARIKKIEGETEAISVCVTEEELEDRAKTVYERFKNGERLDLDDIYLLRRFNLV